MRGRARLAIPLLVGLFACCALGCASPSPPYTRAGISAAAGPVSVVLMPADIELYLVTAGGIPEPRADWTAAAMGHVDRAVRQRLGQSKRVIDYRAPHDVEREAAHTQLRKLHAAVGAMILRHGLSLPSMHERFDWTLGPGARVLAEDAGADYALFLHVRDSYTSAGRAAVMIVAAVAFGAALPGGMQLAYASLVDLRTGEVVWFNQLLRMTGDLRTAGPAAAAVEDLLRDLPL